MLLIKIILTKTHYLHAGFIYFPNKSKPASLQVQSWQFQWDLIKPSPETAKTQFSALALQLKKYFPMLNAQHNGISAFTKHAKNF